MKIYPSCGEIRNYVVKYVRKDGGNHVETRLDDIHAFYETSRENSHELLDLRFDGMSLVYDMEDKKLIFPASDNFYMENFSILKVAVSQYILIGTFLLINEDNEIFKEYRFIGECHRLPEGVSYLPMPGNID